MSERELATFNEYKREARQTARDLCYGKEVMTQINHATSIAEVCRVMTTARHRMEDR